MRPFDQWAPGVLDRRGPHLEPHSRGWGAAGDRVVAAAREGSVIGGVTSESGEPMGNR
jgi:hypothetical protein